MTDQSDFATNTPPKPELPEPAHTLESMVDEYIATPRHEHADICRRIAQRTAYGMSPSECIEIIIDRARLHPRAVEVTTNSESRTAIAL